MVKRIVLNNLIAVVLHAVLNVMSIVTAIIMYLFFIAGGIDRRMSEMLSPALSGIIMFVMLFSLVPICIMLYYFGGRFFMRTAGNIWANLLSVAAPSVVIIAILLISLATAPVHTAMAVAFTVALPFPPVALIVFWGEPPYIIAAIVVFVFSILPSLALWLGLITKKKLKIAADVA